MDCWYFDSWQQIINQPTNQFDLVSLIFIHMGASDITLSFNVKAPMKHKKCAICKDSIVKRKKKWKKFQVFTSCRQSYLIEKK